MALSHILCFVVGILGVQWLRELPSAQWLALLALPAFIPWRFRPQAALLALGALLACWQAQRLLDERWPAERNDEEVWVDGRIASLPDLTELPRTARDEPAPDDEPQRIWRFIFVPDDAGLPQRIRVSWYRADEVIKGGECWRLRLRLKSPHGSLDPGAFDYEAWLFRQGIGATASVREASRCEARGGYTVLRLRQSISDHLASWLPQHPALGLVGALIIGDTSLLNHANWNDFRLAGITHLVAISGFNVAIVSGAAFFLLRWLWSLWPALCLRLPAQKAGMLGAALLSLGYALLAGFEPPVARAVFMLWIILAAAWLHRLAQPSRVLGLAAFLILLSDPLASMTPGFWLSFGAVAAIFYVSLSRRGATPWHAALTLQLMLSVVMTPLTLYFFHGTSWAGPLVNLVAVPLFALLTPLALGAALLAWSVPALGVPALWGVAEALRHFRDALGWLVAHLPQPWLPASPPAAALVLALLGAALLFAPRGLPFKRCAVILFLPLLFPPDTSPRTGFQLTVLDVGQGLSAVVRTAQHTLVFDAGPAFDEGFDAGESIVAPYLLQSGVRHVDLLLISHADSDHSGGAPALRRLLDVREELGALTPTPCRDGRQWDWDGVHFQVLHPDDGDWRGNNGGCVLRVSAGGQALLLAADIEKAAERRLLEAHAQDLPAQILVAPHHGSKTSSTDDFVGIVHPQIVIFSAGWKHHFHHPSPEVVRRYAAIGASAYDTGWAGALTLDVTADGISPVHAWRAQAGSWWNAPGADMPPAEPVRETDTTDSSAKPERHRRKASAGKHRRSRAHSRHSKKKSD